MRAIFIQDLLYTVPADTNSQIVLENASLLAVTLDFLGFSTAQKCWKTGLKVAKMHKHLLFCCVDDWSCWGLFAVWPCPCPRVAPVVYSKMGLTLFKMLFIWATNMLPGFHLEISVWSQSGCGSFMHRVLYPLYLTFLVEMSCSLMTLRYCGFNQWYSANT